jgi:hypothetical protein
MNREESMTPKGIAERKPRVLRQPRRRARSSREAAMNWIAELVAKWREEARFGRAGIGALGGVPISHAHAMATILRAERDADELEKLGAGPR